MRWCTIFCTLFINIIVSPCGFKAVFKLENEFAMGPHFTHSMQIPNKLLYCPFLYGGSAETEGRKNVAASDNKLRK